MTMSETRAEAERQKQMRAAEELLFAGPQKLGVAKGLFLGRFVADWVMPYPTVPSAEQAQLNDSLTRLRTFLDERLDPSAIDRQADIPREVIDGLARLGGAPDGHFHVALEHHVVIEQAMQFDGGLGPRRRPGGQHEQHGCHRLVAHSDSPC